MVRHLLGAQQLAFAETQKLTLASKHQLDIMALRELQNV